MAKTNRPMIRIHNSETNQIVDREMNDAEFAQHEIDLANAQAKLAANVAQVAAKASAIAKLAVLGLTEDEAKAIIG